MPKVDFKDFLQTDKVGDNQLACIRVGREAIELDGSWYMPIFLPSSVSSNVRPAKNEINPIMLVRGDYINSLSSIIDELAKQNKL